MRWRRYIVISNKVMNGRGSLQFRKIFWQILDHDEAFAWSATTHFRGGMGDSDDRLASSLVPTATHIYAVSPQVDLTIPHVVCNLFWASLRYRQEKRLMLHAMTQFSCQVDGGVNGIIVTSTTAVILGPEK